MSHPVQEKPRVPILKKLKGAESIQTNVPIAEAQFLIGKSWDVSLKLDFSEVRDKHCTIEKIAADVWTLSSHENATVQINEYVLHAGCKRFIKCGDFLSLSENIMFQFKCSLLSCDNCNLMTIAVNDEHNNQSSTSISSRRPKFDYDQLLNQNTRLLEYLQSYKNSAVSFTRGIESIDVSASSSSDRLEVYKNLVEMYEHLFELGNSIEHYKNLHVKVLVDIVTCQRDFIDKLRKQLNEFFNNFKSVKDRANQLEGINQHLNNENVTLRSKIAQYIENAETLQNENLDLQAEIVILKAKQERLMSTINSKKEVDKSFDSGADTINSSEINRNCEAVMEVKTKLTKLLETEFKCTICDEVFVEATVTNCGHTFCEQCLSTWKVIKPNCPICRSNLINETKSLAVNSYLNSIMPFAANELRANWLKVVNDRKSANEKSRKNSASKRKFDDADIALVVEFPDFALNRFYQNLFDGFNAGESAAPDLVDLTDDGTD